MNNPYRFGIVSFDAFDSFGDLSRLFLGDSDSYSNANLEAEQTFSIKKEKEGSDDGMKSFELCSNSHHFPGNFARLHRLSDIQHREIGLKQVNEGRTKIAFNVCVHTPKAESPSHRNAGQQHVFFTF